MTNTVTPERQIVAQRVAGLFSSVHQFLDTLKHVGADGAKLTTRELQAAEDRIYEASNWAVRHVLSYGTPEAPPAAPGAEAPIDPPAAPVAPAADVPAA